MRSKFKQLLIFPALLTGFSLYFFAPPAHADSASIAFNHPAHDAFFKYQLYMTSSKPYRGRLFSYFRIYLGPDGTWFSDDRLYSAEHWFTPNDQNDWNGLTPDQQQAKIQWTEDALYHVMSQLMDNPSMLQDGQPNSAELAELIRAIWGKETLRKFTDLANNYDIRDNPKIKPVYDKALLGANEAIRQIALTLPPLAAALNKQSAPPASDASSPTTTVTTTTITETTTSTTAAPSSTTTTSSTTQTTAPPTTSTITTSATVSTSTTTTTQPKQTGTKTKN